MRIRPTARLLVVNDEQRVLLFKAKDQVPLDTNHPSLVEYWCTPGGGVDPGETYEQAAVRELQEETGIVCRELGPCLWSRNKILRFPDEDVEMQERYFLVDAGHCEVETGGQTDYERAILGEHRWWSIEEMGETDQVILPRGIADLIVTVLAGEIPADPVSLPDY